MNEGDRHMKAEFERFTKYRTALAMPVLGIVLAVSLAGQIGCGTFDGVYETDVTWQLYEPTADCQADKSKLPLSDELTWYNVPVKMRTLDSGAITGEITVPINEVSNPLLFSGRKFVHQGIQEAALLTLDYVHDPGGIAPITVECDLRIYGVEKCWEDPNDCDKIMDLFGTANADEPQGCIFFQYGECSHVMDITLFYGERVGNWND